MCVFLLLTIQFIQLRFSKSSYQHTQMAHYEGEKFFGLNFDEYKGKIPYIVSDLIAKLDELQAEEFEGIFRKSGLRTTIDELCQVLDENRIKEWEPKFLDLNVIACALKRFISNLSYFDPLIDDNMEIKLKDAFSDEETKIEKYREVFKNCNNPSKRRTNAYLLKYFNKIASHSDKNLMTAKNLAIILFLPFFPFVGQQIKDENKQILEDLILRSDEVFIDDEFQNLSSYFMTDEDISSVEFKSHCCILI
ncbi:RhoGAP domain containing protein [Tritrichomonas foetus]|uniref:RhoGAP domain containing protein n=1 Tax=Tritrichomonas foetus TaxID=1144522 RepID=A0A1J4JBY5_9EUKA|nr:RhoGAP domain containing protein [Tritrichomonas foetus]|eukprot:OHS96714.1 RhoGAP domain containing protein [Tritrichomonas foetus]